MRRPYADAFDVSERLDHLFIAHAVQPLKIQLAAERVIGQVAYVTELLPGKSGPPHLTHAQVLDRIRC